MAGGWGMRGRVKDGQAPDLCTLQFEADDRGTLQRGLRMPRVYFGHAKKTPECGYWTRFGAAKV